MTETRKIEIGKHRIGEGEPVYFIADIAANHDGEIDRAIRLIHLAAEAGANAAKFQNFHASKIVSDHGFRHLGGQIAHQKAWKESVTEVYQKASLPDDWTAVLKRECDRAGIDYFTSPYDREAVDLVDPWVPAYKIGSGDITYHALVRYIAEKGKPVLVATGASTLDEVDEVMTLLSRQTGDIVLMQCNTNYTGSADNFRFVNLRVLETFRKKYPGVVLGFSDHTPGHAAVLGAVTLGAKVIEKHFTDDTTRTGPDHPFSMDPAAWREMVSNVRRLESAMGDGIKRIEENERESAIVQRRALRAARPLSAGTIVTPADIEALRPIPADGIPPSRTHLVIGRKLIRDLEYGEYLRPDDLE